jgi:hypothetical protein
MQRILNSGRILRLAFLAFLAILLLLLGGCGASNNTDETAPALTFDGILDPSTTTPTRTLSGTVDLGATIQITVGNTAVPDEEIQVADDGSWTATVTLQPGLNLVTVSAFDAVGNQRLFSLNLTYDAVSIETYSTPIPVDNLVIGGLVDPTQTSLTLTVTLPDGTELTPAPGPVSGDTWSAALTGLQEGDNVVKVSAGIPTQSDPVEASVSINFDPAAPRVTIDQPLPFTTDVVPSQTLTGTSDPVATSVTTVPLSAGTPVIDSATGDWSASIEGLNVGKNPVTATVTANGKTVTVRTLLFVDQAPPLVDRVSPAKGAVSVAAAAVVKAVFNTEMDKAKVEAGFTLNGGAVAATVSYDEATKTATLTPNAPLTTGTYTAALATSITDSSGDPLKQLISWDFTVQ